MSPWVLIAENPRAGTGIGAAAVAELAQHLRNAGREVIRCADRTEIRELLERSQAATPESHAQEWPWGCPPEAVVAAGGDGTVSMIADWLVPTTPLAILPLGTENLLARHFRFRIDPRGLADRIVSGPRYQIDAGRANGKLFVVMVSMGFDARVVERVHERRVGHIRKWWYAVPILRTIWDYRYPELRVQVDDEAQPSISRWAFVFNLPRYAGGLPLVPQACGSDGKLDLLLLRDGGLAKGLFYLTAILLRQQSWLRSVQTRTITRVRITSESRVPYQVDGDPGGELPLEIDLLPARLTMVGEVTR